VVGEWPEFDGLAQAVLVEVLPELQLGESGVAGVEQTVAIAVEVAQGVEAGEGKLAVELQRVGAEELGARVDGAVAVAVQHEPGVVAL
jgi:hypothetical protein